MTDKLYGFDTETSSVVGNKKGSLRSIQIYDPEKDRTTILFRPVEQDSWDIYHVFHSDNDRVVKKGGANSTSIVSMIKKFGFITHNGYFDSYVVLRDLGVAPKISGDTFILASLIPSSHHLSASLEAQIQTHCDPNWKKDTNWEKGYPDLETPPEEFLVYGARDAKATYILHDIFTREYPQYFNFIYRLELELLPILIRMRSVGISINNRKFNKSLKEFEARVKDGLLKLISERGKPVKIGSPKDIGLWLYEERGNQPALLTAGGKPSTSEEALLMLEDPIVDAIIESRKDNYILNKIRKIEDDAQGYVDGDCTVYNAEFKPLSDSKGGRIYTADPAISSFPWEIRKSIVPQGYDMFYLADIAAFEFVFLAYAANEEDFLRKYLLGNDLHREVASRVFGKRADLITDHEREIAKTVVYATIYGSEGDSVARKLRITREAGTELVESLFAGFPKMKRLQANLIRTANETGRVSTPLGRVKTFPGIFSSNRHEHEAAKRQALNFFSQSGAADLHKISTIKIDRNMPRECVLNFLVYDSFLIKAPNESFKEDLDKIVENALTFNIKGREWKFRFSSGMGVDWAQAKENMA